MGFKKMWINKEFQKFNKTFEGRMDQEDMSVSTKDFVDSIGADLVESKVFQFLFDANCDGKVSFDEVLQAYGFMETDGQLKMVPKIIIFLDMEVQAKLFFGLIDKDGNGMLSRIEMKQFLAIHHLKNGSADIF
jgi:Ca2+-binding EF-hand superfamily protein